MQLMDMVANCFSLDSLDFWGVPFGGWFPFYEHTSIKARMYIVTQVPVGVVMVAEQIDPAEL